MPPAMPPNGRGATTWRCKWPGSDRTADRVLDDPLVRSYISAVTLEAKQIDVPIGFAIDQTPEQRHDVTRICGLA